MKNKLKIALMLGSVLASGSSYAAGGAQLTGVKGTLKNVERAIKAAISKAEELFEQNGGGDIGAAINLVSSAATPFLTSLEIGVNYTVTVTFAGASGTAFTDTGASAGAGSLATVPVAQALMGAGIKLIPIYNDGDAVINSWECLTNADTRAKTFLGSQVSGIVGNISFISTNGNNGNNEYLSNCIFIDPMP